MTKAQSATLLNTFLARFNKKLPWPMVKQVQAHPLATNPLCLRTLAEELETSRRGSRNPSRDVGEGVKNADKPSGAQSIEVGIA